MSFFSKKENKPKVPVQPVSQSSRQVEDLKARVGITDLPAYVARQVTIELDRLEKTDPVAAEFSISINYIELILTLPWFKETKDNLDLDRAETILASHHSGLEAVKERVLEFLAAKTLKINKNQKFSSSMMKPSPVKICPSISVALAIRYKWPVTALKPWNR